MNVISRHFPQRYRMLRQLGAALLSSIVLVACGGGGSDGQQTAQTEPPPPGPSQTNHPPTLGGNPPTSAMVGQPYVFLPNAADTDGDPLSFSVSNKPSWANFNAQSGRLSGTPTVAGTYSNIVIRVSDGQASVQLAAFAITVSQATTASVTLIWDPPLTNTDGSQVTNLAGYRICYGTSADNLDQVVTVTGEGSTSYVIDNLTAGSWFFGIRAYTDDGLESELSNVVGTTIS